MRMDMENNKWWLDHTDKILTGAVILFWAIVHATAQLKVARDTGISFSWVDYIILIPIAIFAGLCFWLVASLFSESQVWIILSSAIGAFLGIAWLNKLASVVLEFVAIKAQQMIKAQTKATDILSTETTQRNEKQDQK